MTALAPLLFGETRPSLLALQFAGPKGEIWTQLTEALLVPLLCVTTLNVPIDRPTFVVISGPPGCGKSTVAEPLSRRLGIPLFSQDALMEALFDTVGTRDREWARTVSGAAMAVLFELAAASEFALLDAWWERWMTPLRVLPGPLIEIYCRCEPSLAAERAKTRIRHPGHFDHLNDWDSGSLRQPDPLGLGGPLLDLDTNAEVDVEAVARWVLTQLEQKVTGS